MSLKKYWSKRHFGTTIEPRGEIKMDEGNIYIRIVFPYSISLSKTYENAKKAKEDEIERLVRDYQRMVQDSQAEVKKKETELTGSIVKELREIVEKVAQEEGYSIILENVEGIILYSKKELDITEKVVKRYNESKVKQKK